jgi:hypothetical protein
VGGGFAVPRRLRELTVLVLEVRIGTEREEALDYLGAALVRRYHYGHLPLAVAAAVVGVGAAANLFERGGGL